MKAESQQDISTADEPIEQEFISCRPHTAPEPTKDASGKAEFHMVRTAPGSYLLVDPYGNAVVTLYEPLHVDEIRALGVAFTDAVMKGMEQGKASEKNRIRQILQLI